jgi:hypothetical protein
MFTKKPSKKPVKMSKPGDMFNAFMKKKLASKKKGGLRPADAVVKSEQNASHQFYKKKHKKMTQTQDDAYDKKHGIKEGSKEDIKQDTKHGIKDKKAKKSKKKLNLLDKAAVGVYNGVNKVGKETGRVVGGVGKALGVLGKGFAKNTFGDPYGATLKAQGYGKNKKK